MKNILLAILSFLALSSGVLAAFLVWQVKTLRHANDELSDDKAALLIERQKWDFEHLKLLEEERSLRNECRAHANELARVREEKEALGRSLVKMMDSCAVLKMELIQKDKQLATAEAARVAQEKAAREQQAREKAAREQQAREKAAREQRAREKAAREQQAREKAEADRLATLAQNPLRVEDLKPVDPKKAPKSDQESLEELLELTAQKGSKGTQTKDVK